MADKVKYRFEAFLYEGRVGRIEIETGEADWVYIRRRSHQLAAERGEQVLLYVFNSLTHSWNYLGYALPGNVWFNHSGSGPFKLSSDGRSYKLKEGGAL